MEEKNPSVKRRERIKTILIIFLALLLVLTFFSNTIMNHSLPRVSAQYGGYGSISEKVRGSGVVSANQNYEVTAEGNRKISSVAVKIGDEVNEGDTLFVLESSKDDETVKTAEQELESAELAYQKALLTAAPDYADKNQDIADAREALQTATRKLNDARRQSSSAISESAYRQATATAKSAADRAQKLSGYLTAIESGELDSIPSEYRSGIVDAYAALQDASAKAAEAQADADAKAAAVTVSSAEQEATIRSLEREAESADMAYDRAKADYEANKDTELQRLMEDAEQKARYAHEDVENAKKALTEIQAKEEDARQAKEKADAAAGAKNTAQQSYDTASSGIMSILRADIESANREADDANQIVNAYDSQNNADIDTLEENVRTCERTLQTALTTLAKSKKDDDLAKQIADLDLESQRNDIERKKDALADLKKDAGTVTVTSKNAGVVSAVNFSAGDDVTDGAVLCSLTLTGSGYTLQFSVTAEQAKKVKPGVKAEITNNYYSDMQAILLTNKADTTNPGSTDRILTFEITGRDVTAGEMLALVIPCSSQNYDCVVPSSAINEDKDGKFVLVVRPKNTPLGNRYYAERADVTILATDEINSAVQGNINYSDFVITTSEKPLKPGDQVRMED